jgi:2-deoxy-D-gluconate 3-dehydrogenase
MLMKYTDLFHLGGKTAVVTGASRGLGRAIAAALNSAGANVLLVSRDIAGMEETQNILSYPGLSTVYQCDVADEPSVRSLLDSVPDAYRAPDILVNNAGIIRRNPAVHYTLTDWDDVINTNLRSVFILSQEAGKRMIVKGGGKIINIASVLSFTGGVNVVAYAAAKGGVAQLTKALANEWAKHNVNVNAITPGYFITNATAALRADAERAKFTLSRIPQGRWGEPDDLAGAAIFLASRASDYVNGHILCVDGGWNSY